MMNAIREMDQTCKESDIITSLTALKERNAPITDLEEVMNIIQNVIPLHLSLKEETLKLLFCVTSRSPFIISQIVAYTNSIDQGQPTSQEQQSSKFYRDFIFQMLSIQPDCLYNNIMAV